MSKQITKDESNLAFVKAKMKEGLNITKSVQELCATKGFEYTDNLRRTFSMELQKSGFTDTSEKKPIEASEEYQEALKRKPKKSKYYIISSCQAETPIHKQFWQNMNAFAEHIGAEILIQPSRYKNPTSLESSRKIESNEKNRSMWAKEVREHLYASDIKLNKYLKVLFGLKIQPSAKNPLSGTNNFSGDASAIIPHCKLALQSSPVLPSYPKKLLLTTGAVTHPNFTDTRIGYEGAWTHQYGFVLAEVVNKEDYFVHQVSSDDSGTFYFLDYKVENGVVTKGKVEYPAIVYGDVHFPYEDSEAVDTAIEITNRLNAGNVFLEDVADMRSINHHEERSPIALLQKEEDGGNDLGWEIASVISKVRELSGRVGANIHIKESNHPLWLDKWIADADWRKTGNKKMYLKLANILAEGKNGNKNLLNYLIDCAEIERVTTYTENDSLKIHGYEMLIHGHRGASGSRGGLNQFKNLSTKGISAHSHSPSRANNWLVAGTLTPLNPEYVKGLGSWLQGVVVIQPNGRATHINIINGKYSTL